ncbi:hypothetical protein HY449_03275 [Candidatus Pacearchaeota archaeon]|nr:hypothetical protein [Candidatus Pacearchaeota archaeon]
MNKTRNGLVSLVAAGVLALGASGCANYFRGATPGVEIGNDAVEKNCKTYSVESISIEDIGLYHLGFPSKKGEIEHGFYRRDHSRMEIDPSCKQVPSVKSNEQRGDKEGLYFLVPAAEKNQEAKITLKNKLDLPEPESKEKTSVLGLGKEVRKSYDLNELFRDNRMQLPGDNHFYFVFPAAEVVEPISTPETGSNSPKYLPVVLIDTRTKLIIDNKTGNASFVDRDKKQNKIKRLKFLSEEEAKKYLGYKSQ